MVQADCGLAVGLGSLFDQQPEILAKRPLEIRTKVSSILRNFIPHSL